MPKCEDENQTLDCNKINTINSVRDAYSNGNIPPPQEITIVNDAFEYLIKNEQNIIDKFTQMLHSNYVLLSRRNLIKLIEKLPDSVTYINLIYIGKQDIHHFVQNVEPNSQIQINVSNTKSNTDRICCIINGTEYCDLYNQWNVIEQNYNIDADSPVFQYTSATTTTGRRRHGGTKKHHLRRGRRQSSRRHKKVVVRKSRRL